MLDEDSDDQCAISLLYLFLFGCKDTAHFLQLGCKLLITLKNGIDRLLGKLLGQEADNPYHWESTHHGDSTAVDGVAPRQ